MSCNKVTKICWIKFFFLIVTLMVNVGLLTPVSYAQGIAGPPLVPSAAAGTDSLSPEGKKCYTGPQYPGGNRCNSIQSCLSLIALNTYGILQTINNLPNYVCHISKMAISWLSFDESKSTATIQGTFAGLGSTIIKNFNTQLELQPRLIADLIAIDAATGQPWPSNTMGIRAQKPNALDKIPNLNDLTYATMLHAPPFPNAPQVKEAPYNYVKNVSGTNLLHIIPGPNWTGPLEKQLKYSNYYNTVMGISSFNGYVMSDIYADSQGKKDGFGKEDPNSRNGFIKLQNKLVAQASNSEWLTTITTADLGVVIRQLLMFQSQTYVLLTQLVQLQKQTLTSQIMTNTLLMSNNQNNEILMVNEAKG